MLAEDLAQEGRDEIYTRSFGLAKMLYTLVEL
jgi:hypothetical protein